MGDVLFVLLARLPKMHVCIKHCRGDNLSFSINHLSAWRNIQIFSHRRNDSILDQDVTCSQGAFLCRDFSSLNE